MIFTNGHRSSLSRASLLFGLSITVIPRAVNAQPASPISRTQSAVSGTKSSETDFSRIISTVIKKGDPHQLGKHIAPILGLPQESFVKTLPGKTENLTSGSVERQCSVVYESIRANKGPSIERPTSVYFSKRKYLGQNAETTYYRVTLAGELEKAVLSRGKFDDTGKPIRGSGVKTDLDVGSTNVKKAFQIEWNYWTQDWLKEQDFSK